jgi:hypothetical protein
MNTDSRGSLAVLGIAVGWWWLCPVNFSGVDKGNSQRCWMSAFLDSGHNHSWWTLAANQSTQWHQSSYWVQALPSSDVQLGHLVALIAMLVRQKGHSFSVSSAGSSSWACSLLIPRMSKNTAKATIRKLMTALINTP